MQLLALGSERPPGKYGMLGQVFVSSWRGLLAVLLLFVAAGCGDSGSPTTPTATTAITTPTAAEQRATVTQAIAPSLVPVTQAPTAVATQMGGFQNPVLKRDFADPFVLKAGDKYYAYSTNASGANVQVARSTDLVKWDVLTDALPGAGSWAKLGGSFIWAPEVIHIGDKYVLYYTARDKASDKQCVGVGVSDKPEGKFKDSRDKPLVCQSDEGGTIDASPFRDGDKLYLYYKNDGNCCNIPTYLYAQEMGADGMSLVGAPTRLVRNDAAWEGRVVEAPTMWKHDGKYYLFYSANNYAGIEYAVGYANCQSAVGPCEDAPENPILASRMSQTPLVIGPGHQSVIEDKDGETYLVYHAWNVTSSGLRGSSRFMWIDRLDWKDGKPVVQGPTTDPQPVP